MNDNYVLVRWPESQYYMECDWFRDEAILAVGHEDETGSSAYFIPESRVLDNSYIKQRVVELCENYEITEKEGEDAKLEWEKEKPYEGGMTLNDLIVETSLLIKKISSAE